MADEWLEERTAELRRLWVEGFSMSQIGRRLGVTKNAVIGKCYRLGLRDADRAPSKPRRVSAAPKAPPRPRPPKAARVPKPIWKPAVVFGDIGQPRPQAQPVEPIDLSQARPWTERKFGECAYPVDGEGGDVRSCCLKTDSGSYCAHHRRIVYQAGTANAPRVRRRALYGDTAAAPKEAAEPDLYDLVAA